MKLFNFASLFSVITISVTSCGAASAQIKSADEILKDIRVEGRASFNEASLGFKLDSTKLIDQHAEAQVGEIAKALGAPTMKAARFIITGHTCDLGSDTHNQDLSVRRAAAIKKLLAANGIAAQRIHTEGKGESSPAVPNTSDSNRPLNRRVVITKR